MNPSIHFWIVHNNIEKRQRIREITYKHFSQSHRILILVPNQPSLIFVDQLLWQMDPDQFIPHTISSEPIQAAVVITAEVTNLNRAQVLWNLCGSGCPIANQFENIHELDDRTDATKAQSALKKKEYYQAAGFLETTP